MSDYIDVWFPYEEPKVFARELTMRDWEPGGVVYEGLHGSGECDPSEVYPALPQLIFDICKSLVTGDQRQ